MKEIIKKVDSIKDKGLKEALKKNIAEKLASKTILKND